MDTDDEELKETKRKFNSIYGKTVKNIAYNKEMSLYEMEQQEKKLIRELKMILHDGECKPNWRETINDTIKLLEGE